MNTDCAEQLKSDLKYRLWRNLISWRRRAVSRREKVGEVKGSGNDGAALRPWHLLLHTNPAPLYDAARRNQDGGVMTAAYVL